MTQLHGKIWTIERLLSFHFVSKSNLKKNTVTLLNSNTTNTSRHVLTSCKKIPSLLSDCQQHCLKTLTCSYSSLRKTDHQSFEKQIHVVSKDPVVIKKKHSTSHSCSSSLVRQQSSLHHLSGSPKWKFYFLGLSSRTNIDFGNSVEPSHLLSICTAGQKRWKSKKTREVDSDDEESDSEEDQKLDDDDFDAPPKFKVMKLHVASLRADTLVSAALQVGRSKLEEVFFGPGLLLNGEKMLKKATKMDDGDFCDLVLDRADGQYKVKRVKVLRVYEDKTKSGKQLVKVRVWKTPFFLPIADKRPS